MKTVWLDLETTGLDPSTDTILEIGLVVQDDPRATPIPQSRVVHFKGVIENDFVFDMHVSSGLLSECRRADPHRDSLYVVEDWAVSCLLGTGPRDVCDHRGRFQLAGASVHFDLAFLRVHMPRLASLFSHRLLDTTAIGLFCQGLGMLPKDRTKTAHRVCDDILDCHAYFVACQDFVQSYTRTA